MIIQQTQDKGPLHAIIVDKASPTPILEGARELGMNFRWGSEAHERQSNRDETPTDYEGQTAKISISHDGDYATAVCLAADDPS